jgi:hypothetical protein
MTRGGGTDMAWNIECLTIHLSITHSAFLAATAPPSACWGLCYLGNTQRTAAILVSQPQTRHLFIQQQRFQWEITCSRRPMSPYMSHCI